MAPRLTSLFTGEPGPDAEDDSGRSTAVEPLPPPGAPLNAAEIGRLRRARRLLMRDRDARIRDLGGLALEMVRRERFRRPVLERRAAEVLDVERRIHAIDAVLRAAPPSAGAPTIPGIAAEPCVCGNPLGPKVRFCPVCGRAAGEPRPPPSENPACATCGSALPVEARFCPSCGAVAPAGEP